MSKTKVTFVRHVKFAGQRYAAGDSVDVNADDFAALDKAKAIDFKERPAKETAAFDFATASRKDLEKVKNDELKAYMDEQGIEYAADDVKADLISHILGESDSDDEGDVVVVADEEGDE